MEIKPIQVFNSVECLNIIKAIELNKHKLSVSSDNGGIYLSGYEMDIEEMGDEITSLITNRINKLVDGSIVQAFAIKYNSELMDRMENHYDASTYSIPINLNNDYDGGGTHFPLIDYTHKPQEHEVGVGILFEADKLKSWHGALPVTRGTRYTIVVKIDVDKPLIFTILDSFLLIGYGFYNRHREKKRQKVESVDIIK